MPPANRTAANYSETLADPQQAPPIPGNASATYNANNQVQSASPGPVPTYDPSGDGDVTNDGQNEYLYDAEGRVCAVDSLLGRGMYGYLYNAEGVRVAKGRITTFSCNTAANGFQVTASYILDPNNRQLTELSWSGGTPQWAHTNVFAAGLLTATYSVNPDPSDNQPGILNFLLSDWLGTRRVMTDYAGNMEESCHSLPYGEGEDCAPTPTELLFTQKERDAESGNDYFGARYYASLTGRFLMPDWSARVEPVPYAQLGNPQSLNLYAYVRNNPLISIDPSGHLDCSLFDGNISACMEVATLGDSAPADGSFVPYSSAQQQSGSSSGGGFWSGVGHGLSNWFHGHPWGYVQGTVSAFIANTWDAKDPNVTVVTDTTGLAGLASETVGRALSVPNAVVSSYNDQGSLPINLLGLLPGFEGLAIPQATVDYMDWVNPSGHPYSGWDFNIPKKEQPTYNPYVDSPEDDICQDLGVNGCQ